MPGGYVSKTEYIYLVLTPLKVHQGQFNTHTVSHINISNWLDSKIVKPSLQFIGIIYDHINFVILCLLVFCYITLPLTRFCFPILCDDSVSTTETTLTTNNMSNLFIVSLKIVEHCINKFMVIWDNNYGGLRNQIRRNRKHTCTVFFNKTFALIFVDYEHLAFGLFSKFWLSNM